MRVDGLKAYAKFDALFLINGSAYILDWKTGKRREKEHARQLRAYSAWACYHLNIRPTDITPIIAYLLPTYEEVTVSLNDFDLEDFARSVHNETQEMYQYCSNVEENIPLDKDAFPLCSRRTLCSYCNYRELCSLS